MKRTRRVPDDLIYRELQRRADEVAQIYQCDKCPGVNLCDEGRLCYKDYIVGRRDQGKDVDYNKLPTRWKWIREVSI